jgi:serine/threonine protein kinase
LALFGKNFNSPLIIQTYSLQADKNRYALVMEDFGGISLKEWGTGENLRNLTEFLRIAIARQFIEETHNGKLTFNSVLGQGTEFFIEMKC